METRKTILDTDQRAAYQADQNVVVSAGAGSGKTTVLAERYVRLVTERGLEVSEVLTLTFTRKAASEMYERIFRRLAANQTPLARERLAKFDQARISTLDAFCSSITRGGAYRYGISSDFRVDERALRRCAEETALECLLRRRGEDPVRRLIAARSFESVLQDLFAETALTAFSFVLPGRFAAQADRQLRYLIEETRAACAALNEAARLVLGRPASAFKGKTLGAVRDALDLRLPLELGGETDAEVLAAAETLADTAAYLGDAKILPLPRGKDPVSLEVREAEPVSQLP